MSGNTYHMHIRKDLAGWDLIFMIECASILHVNIRKASQTCLHHRRAYRWVWAPRIKLPFVYVAILFMFPFWKTGETHPSIKTSKLLFWRIMRTYGKNYKRTPLHGLQAKALSSLPNSRVLSPFFFSKSLMTLKSNWMEIKKRRKSL